MKNVVSVREYARLTTEFVHASPDQATVTDSAFEYLCTLNASFSKAGARLIQIEGRRWLRLDNYVGVVQTPCGTTIEILPKTHDDADELDRSRTMLRKMLVQALELPTREVGEATLERFNGPISEWVIKKFLTQLDRLLKRGVRFEYQRIEEELPYLRGQLNLTAQMRQAPGRQHFFNVRHDVFTADRAENRLIKSALEVVRGSTNDPDSWRVAQEMSHMLHDIPESQDVRTDLSRWSQDRLMHHYQLIKPWCEMLLLKHLPLAVLGEHKGLSLLFPMEKLFEKYVANWLRIHLPSDSKIRTPAASESLCTFNGAGIFQLEPDIFIQREGKKWVLDTKWKRINSANREKKFDLSQADFYQMHAYGHKYMDGKGTMALIYPKTSKFDVPLSPFLFGNNLELRVLPFDIENDTLIGGSDIGLPIN